MEQRRHPMCQVKGCERLESRRICVGVKPVPEGAVFKVEGYAPIDVGLCEKHADSFYGAKDVSISMKRPSPKCTMFVKGEFR